MVVIASVAVLLAGLRCSFDAIQYAGANHRDYFAQKAVSSLRMERQLREEATAHRHDADEALKAMGRAEGGERERLRSLSESLTAKAEKAETWAAQEARRARESLHKHLSTGKRLSDLPEWILRELVGQPLETQ